MFLSRRISIAQPTSLLTVSLFSLLITGCSSNTVVDDSSYRTIGGGNPRNPHPSAPEGLSADPEFSMDAEQGFSANTDFSYEGGIPKGSFPGSGSGSGAGHAKGGHVKRYGNAGIIEKIAKIAQIHCKPLSFTIKTTKQSFWGEQSGTLSQCTYQFPEFCGSHRYLVLSYAKKKVLIYNQSDSPYYIIDTLEGTNASQPGLWDKDDKLGSKASNMSYMFNENYNPQYQQGAETPLNLGWVIKASHHDEVQHGSHYHQAIEETATCF